jgi:hypothetical protein
MVNKLMIEPSQTTSAELLKRVVIDWARKPEPTSAVSCAK